MRRNGIIICLCLLLAGCAPSPAPADSPPAPAVAFTDALGREVTVQKADRVAAMESPTDEDLATITLADLKELMDVPIE